MVACAIEDILSESPFMIRKDKLAWEMEADMNAETLKVKSRAVDLSQYGHSQSE